ncbi:CAP domain-containing protein [Streptomyces sp. NBC_00233]|uniref:CAP domain-containing protein n=1 Tax=Streptomyces sp. NBC_00233 TaxID=2975686 RepID=UPI00225B9BEA|nr:CAP domain-containing protein [Streptomyces sp. NBC_00233]MCX5230696.1 CAP domain-containing protein [Streptomyces sp. NBC_00233]
MRQSTGIERDTGLVLAARNGDPWARDQLITAHLPLIHTTVALAMNGRHGAEHVEHVVRETMLRALDGLPTLTDPEVFRPWLVAIAVDGIRRHRHQQPAGYGAPAEQSSAHGQAYEITEAARWLDPDDGEQLALWWLECAGELTRYETAAALRWPAEEAPARIEAVRARLDAARVVVGALAGNPACPFLGREAAEWDGRPSAPWRDHLAHHTIGCGHCAPRWHALVPAEVLLAAASPVLAARTDEAPREATTPTSAPPAAAGGTGTVPGAYAATDGDPHGTSEGADRSDTAHLAGYGHDHAANLTEPYLLAGSAGHTRSHLPRSAPASSAPGRHGTRAALRRRRQTQERSRRRAVIAAGVVVMAVTGGAFSLYGGRGGDDEILEANRVTAPELDLPLDQDPSTHSGTPSAAATTPTTSPSASRSATGRPSASASPSAKPTTASPRPVRTAKPAPVKTTPPRTAAPTPDAPPTRPGSGTGTGSGSGDEAGNGTGAGPQNDQGQSSEADQVIALVNAERAKAGCGPLSANATLTRAAQGHSDDMAARDFFDHTNPDGAGPGERVTAAGYPWSTYGENIAMGQSSPEQVMESWMNSPGHRANILNCDFKEIGVGIHSQGGPYWTQVFGAR